MDDHSNRGSIHSRGLIPGGGISGHHNFTSVIREHIHRHGEGPVHQRDSPFHSYSPYRHETLSKEKDMFHKRPGSGSPPSAVKMCERFRWDENAFRGRESGASHSDEHARERDEERSSPARRSSQASPVDSVSSRGSPSVGRRDSASTPPTSQRPQQADTQPQQADTQPPYPGPGGSSASRGSPSTAEPHHISSPSGAEYLGLPAIPHPTYPPPHHIPPQSLPGVCLPIPQVSTSYV